MYMPWTYVEIDNLLHDVYAIHMCLLWLSTMLNLQANLISCLSPSELLGLGEAQISK